MASTPRPARGREAKKRQASSGAAASSLEQTSRVNTSVPVTTVRVAGLTSTATVFVLAGPQMNDLKLSGMQTIVRAAALVLTLAVTGYLLQLGPAVPTAVGSAVASVHPITAPLEGLRPAPSAHEFFLSRHQVVPVGRRNIALPILMYHYIRTPPSMRYDRMGYKLSISPADFAAQMEWLARNGVHPVDFNTPRAHFARKQPLPTKPVVITLDDGYADLYTAAFPILTAHDFKAVAYIVSGFVGWPGYATADQIVQMDHNGIEIASHTVHHADLARSSAGSVRNELVESKLSLEHLLGHPV